MSTESVNIKCCALPYKSPLETLQMLEEAFGKVGMVKYRFTSSIKIFVMAALQMIVNIDK
jgi:hypothetical protein